MHALGIGRHKRCCPDTAAANRPESAGRDPLRPHSRVFYWQETVCLGTGPLLVAGLNTHERLNTNVPAG
jgi:hypothetical protein